jgi:putative transposase
MVVWHSPCESRTLPGSLKELEEENRRLKKMYAEERLKAEIITEAMAKKW